MKPRKGAKAPTGNVHRQLLVEGAKSYVHTVTALLEYRREVQQRCRAVLKGQLTKYAAVLGIEPKQLLIKDWAEPDVQDWSSEHVNLGVIFNLDDRMKGICWSSYCSLTWDSTPTGWFGPCVGMWFATKRQASALRAKLQELEIREFEWDDYEVWLWQHLNADRAATFEKPLARLLTRWIDACKQIGGFKAILG